MRNAHTPPPPPPAEYPAPATWCHQVSQQDLDVYAAIVGSRPVMGLPQAPAATGASPAARSGAESPTAAAMERASQWLRYVSREVGRRTKEAMDRLSR